MRHYEPGEVEYIQDRACERIAEILDAMGVEYTEHRDYLQGPCPVHGGDNQRALYWAISTRHWRCTTQHCERGPETGCSNSVFGLVRGVMARKSGKKWSFQQAVNFVAGALGIAEITVSPKTQADLEIDRAIRTFRKRQSMKPNTKGVPLSEVLSRMVPDTVYYPKRGVSQDVIAKYHISYCSNEKQPFFQRAFFPVLDETGRYVQGWSARSIFERCSQCKMHHPPDMECSGKGDKHKWVKWRHSSGLRVEQCLYNIWHARPHIAKTGTAIVCEGPGDVWAYEQAGIHNSVAMMGLNLSQQQRKLLQKAGALTLVFTLDNDKAGHKAQSRFLNELQWYFRVFFVSPDGKDIGETPPDDIRELVLPVLKKVSREGVLGGM